MAAAGHGRGHIGAAGPPPGGAAAVPAAVADRHRRVAGAGRARRIRAGDRKGAGAAGRDRLAAGAPHADAGGVGCPDRAGAGLHLCLVGMDGGAARRRCVHRLDGRADVHHRRHRRLAGGGGHRRSAAVRVRDRPVPSGVGRARDRHDAGGGGRPVVGQWPDRGRRHRPALQPSGRPDVGRADAGRDLPVRREPARDAVHQRSDRAADRRARLPLGGGRGLRPLVELDVRGHAARLGAAGPRGHRLAEPLPVAPRRRRAALVPVDHQDRGAGGGAVDRVRRHRGCGAGPGARVRAAALPDAGRADADGDAACRRQWRGRVRQPAGRGAVRHVAGGVHQREINSENWLEDDPPGRPQAGGGVRRPRPGPRRRGARAGAARADGARRVPRHAAAPRPDRRPGNGVRPLLPQRRDRHLGAPPGRGAQPGGRRSAGARQRGGAGAAGRGAARRHAPGDDRGAAAAAARAAGAADPGIGR